MGAAKQLLEEVRTLGARACVCAVAAKLALLKELPWHIAGSTRPEAFIDAAGWLADAYKGLPTEAARAQKITPAELACKAMQGNMADALGAAEAWLQACTSLFGKEDCYAHRARRFSEELQAESLAQPSSGGRARSREAFRRALCDALACAGVGLREPSSVGAGINW